MCQIVFTKIQVSIKFFYRKGINISYVIKTKVLVLIFFLYYYHLFIAKAFEITGDKKDMIIICNSRYNKIVFTYLNEIIILYIRLTLIKIGLPRLKKPFFRLFKVS